MSLGTSSKHCVDALEQLDPTVEMAEIRVDLMEDCLQPNALETVFSKAYELQISAIATVREISSDPGFSATRLSLVKQCLTLPGCTYVDVEVEAPEEYIKMIVACAKEHNVSVVVSHHNFKVEENSSENLDAVVDDCFAKGAAIAKIAVSVCSPQGAARILSLYNDKRAIVALGMGESGKITRVSAIPLGAPFSFAAWDDKSATAPGQLSRQKMKDALLLSGWSFEPRRKKSKSMLT